MDIKEINEKTIPEIYRYINEKCKGKIDSQKPYKNKINQIKVNNSNNSNNFNNIYNKNPININNNNNINQITESDYIITISNGNLNNKSNDALIFRNISTLKVIKQLSLFKLILIVFVSSIFLKGTISIKLR